MRTTTILCGLLLICAAGHIRAEDLPRGAQRAAERYEKAVQEAQEDFARSMEKELERATKAGDLDEALAIRAEIARVTGAPQGAAPAGGMAGPVVPDAGDAAAWEALRGITVTVLASAAETPVPGLTLQPGQQIAVIPHPEDRWQGTVGGVEMDFNGSRSMNSDRFGPACPNMAMLVRIGEGVTQASQGPHAGTGRVTLLVNDGGLSDNRGSIRVKVVAVQ